jgi:hypothetical protein
MVALKAYELHDDVGKTRQLRLQMKETDVSCEISTVL